LFEQTIKDFDEAASMAIYTNTGFILANYLPATIGKQLVDVETQYCSYLNQVVNAVKNAQEYECSSKDINAMTGFSIILAVTAIAAAAVVTFLVLVRTFKPINVVADVL
jgi:hypothetical protein